MEIDCIFSSLLYCEINDIVNCLSTNKIIYGMKTQYLWKLLFEREFIINNISTNTSNNNKWGEKYKEHCMLTKLKNKLNLNYSLHELCLIT